MNGKKVQQCKIVEVGVPKSYASTALAAEFINMAKANKVTWVN